MTKIEVKNARITSTMLGKEGHGIMSCYLSLNYGSSAQSFGGWALGGEWGMEFITRLMTTVGVEKWEDLTGQHVRAKAEQFRVHAIGHITDDKWFDPAADLAHLLPKEEATHDRTD